MLLFFYVTNQTLQDLSRGTFQELRLNDLEVEAFTALLSENQVLTRIVVWGFSLRHPALHTAANENCSLVEMSLPGIKSNAITARNKRIQWPLVHDVILGICLALLPLDVPPYVLLQIIDFLPDYISVSHVRKINLIQSIYRSNRRVRKIED